MQGTIAEFDEQTHTGALLRDDGSRVEFGPDAFAASGLRLLRVGQRVQAEVGPDGTVTRVVIPTVPHR